MAARALRKVKDSAEPRLRDPLRKALRDLIVGGKLASGQKLNEARLAAQLDTSRTPLREALLHLEREGLVRSDLRRGFSVAPFSSDEVREIYPVLAQLECLAVKSSAEFLPAVLPELTKINRAFAVARTAKQALELDTLWHDTLMSRSRNKRLAAMVEQFRLSIRRYEQVYMGDESLRPISAAQHKAIIAAFREGDIATGLRAIEDNYRFGMEALLQKMEGP
jgi:DNA-binding GntR family transcriptional regulator